MERDATHAHDHSHCEGHGQTLALEPLTPSRQAILDLLCEAGRPLGAYDLIDRIAQNTGKRPAPMSIYRALDYLVEHGLAHRLSSRNAFMACGHRHDRDAPLAFLICDGCGGASEQTAAALGADLDALTAASGFRRRAQVIEIAGLCARCRGEG